MRRFGFIAVTNTGVLSVIFHDIMEEIGKKASLRVNWVEEVGYENIFPGWTADGTTFSPLDSGPTRAARKRAHLAFLSSTASLRLGVELRCGWATCR
jgi:hypothetical protein